MRRFEGLAFCAQPMECDDVREQQDRDPKAWDDEPGQTGH
jgi:hypothetical protein